MPSTTLRTSTKCYIHQRQLCNGSKAWLRSQNYAETAHASQASAGARHTELKMSLCAPRHSQIQKTGTDLNVHPKVLCLSSQDVNKSHTFHCAAFVRFASPWSTALLTALECCGRCTRTPPLSRASCSYSAVQHGLHTFLVLQVP